MAQIKESPAGDGGAFGCLAGRRDTLEHTQNRRAIQRSAPPPASAISERKHQPGETTDDYRHVVAQLSDGWRVIVCAGGIQWILQRRDGERAGRARWVGIDYCRTRKALLRQCRASHARIDPAAWSVLDELPAHIAEMPQ